MLSSVLITGVVVVSPSTVGEMVEVQLELSVKVRLHPSVVSGRGRVISGRGGYITDPMLRHSDATKPDMRPDNPPC